MIDENKFNKFKKSYESKDIDFDKASKSNSEFSLKQRNSVSRIFQPSPDKMQGSNRMLNEL